MPRLWAYAAILLALHAALATTSSPSLLQVNVRTSVGRDVSEGLVLPPDAAARTMKALDTDGDGFVGPDEIVNFAKLLHIDGSKAASDLKELDADGDGKLNANELMKVLSASGASPDSAVPAAKKEPAAQAAPRAVAAAQQASSLPPDIGERTMKALDKNGDGFVGPDEITNFASMLHIDGSKAATDLKELDADGDGKLNKAELMKVLQGAKIEAPASPSAVPAAEVPRPPAAAVPPPAPASAVPAAPAAAQGSASHPAVQKAPAAPVAAAQAAVVANTVPTTSPAVAPLAAAQAGVVANAAAAISPAVVSTLPTGPTAPQPGASSGSPAVVGAILAGSANRGPAAALEAAAPFTATQTQGAADPSAVQLADLLVSTGSEEDKAMSLEGVAEELDANSTLLARQAMSSAQQAAAQAAQRVAGEIMGQFKVLQQQAEQAEIEAARLRAKARIELQSATLATLIAEKALQNPASAANI